MYNFSYQNKLFELYIFKFYNKVTDDDILKYEKNIQTLSKLNNKFYVVFDIRNITDISIENFITMSKKLFNNTKLIENKMDGCAIIVSGSYINTIKVVFNIIKTKICNYLVTKEIEEAFIYLNKLKSSKFENINFLT